MEMCHFLRVIKVRRSSMRIVESQKRMSTLQHWIIVIQIVLTSSGRLYGADDGEHVHIKVHVPEIQRHHTHIRKIQKHYFHPKKVVKAKQFLGGDLDTTPFDMLSYGFTSPAEILQYPSYPNLGLSPLEDIPSYGMDNTLEATITKSPKVHSISQYIGDGMLGSFQGMKQPTEFFRGHPMSDGPSYAAPSIGDDEDVEDYDGRSTEAMDMDQRVAGSMYPFHMGMGMNGMGGHFKSNRPAYGNLFESPMKSFSSGIKGPSYANHFEFPMKPYGSGFKGGLPPDWMGATTEGGYFDSDRFPSSTTMHITRARPLPSSRFKFGQQQFERDPFSQQWTAPKKKKSKKEKRNRKPSSGLRINY